MSLNWMRPTNVLYPNVWLKFKAKDVDTDNMVEYMIQDLPEDRFDEAIEIMAKQFLADAPMAKLKDGVNDKEYVEDNVRIWKKIVHQKMPHVCFKDGSKEIIGVNMNYVSSKDDNLLSDIKSDKFLQNIKVYAIFCDRGNFNVFDKYGVDKYLSSFGIYVPKKYAGRKIGEKLLEASKHLAKSCDIHLRHGFFSSDISNRIADKLGYTIDVELSFDEIQHIDSSLSFENIDSSRMALRTWIFEED